MGIFNTKRKIIAAREKFETIMAQVSKTYPITDAPIVHAILHSIADTGSTLGLDLYQSTRTGRYKAYNHPTARLLEYPNQEDSATQFLYRAFYHYCGYGNVYILNTGNALLQLLDPSKMEVVRSKVAPFEKTFKYRVNGAEYASSQVLHIYNPQYFDGTVGRSVLDVNRGLIELYNSLLLYVSMYFNNSAGERLYITLGENNVKDLKDPVVKKMFEQFLAEKITGPLVAGRPALLQPGMDIKSIKQATNAEAELSSLIERVESEIARLFGFPLYKLTGDYGNNLQYQQINYYQSCILPITEVFKEKFNTLLPPKDRPWMSFEFDYDNLLMPDLETRHKIIREDVRGGLRTINEGRRLINAEQYSGEAENIADALWMLQNYAPVLNMYKDRYFKESAPSLDNPEKQVEDSNTN